MSKPTSFHPAARSFEERNTLVDLAREAASDGLICFSEKEDAENGIWRTINGRRVFIRQGESLDSALERSKRQDANKGRAEIDPDARTRMRAALTGKTDKRSSKADLEKASDDSRAKFEKEQAAWQAKVSADPQIKALEAELSALLNDPNMKGMERRTKEDAIHAKIRAREEAVAGARPQWDRSADSKLARTSREARREGKFELEYFSLTQSQASGLWAKFSGGAHPHIACYNHFASSMGADAHAFCAKVEAMAAGTNPAHRAAEERAANNTLALPNYDRYAAFADGLIELADSAKSRFMNKDGTFKNGFDGCVEYMKSQGHDEESGKKICGKIAANKGMAGHHSDQTATAAFGEGPGHPFRGNQYSRDRAKAEATSKRADKSNTKDDHVAAANAHIEAATSAAEAGDFDAKDYHDQMVKHHDSEAFKAIGRAAAAKEHQLAGLKSQLRQVLEAAGEAQGPAYDHWLAKKKDLEHQIEQLTGKKFSVEQFGDRDGHPFRGNQWTNHTTGSILDSLSLGLGREQSSSVRTELRDNGRAVVNPGGGAIPAGALSAIEELKKRGWQATTQEDGTIELTPPAAAEFVTATFGEKKGHPFRGNQFSAGQRVRFDGKSPDGKVNGSMDVTILDPHTNASAVTNTDNRGVQYEGANRHLGKARVRSDRGAEFEAYHHQLSAKR